MKKYTFVLVILALCALLEPAMAQKRRARYKRNIPIWYRSRFYTTVGGGVGSANYFGDLAPASSFVSTDIQFFRTSLFGYVTHKFTPRITGKAQLSWHRLKGDDNISANATQGESAGRYLRNLHFRNDIIELSGMAMFDLFENNSPFFKRPRWAPYGFIGLGVIYSNPTARLNTNSANANGEWVALRPLQTEGKSYSPIQIVIPFGIGIRYKLSQRVDLGFDVGYRYTFSDYIDDVSGNYAHPSSLSSQLSRDMADRTNETFGADTGLNRTQDVVRILTGFGKTNASDPNYNPFSASEDIGNKYRGSRRGNPKDNDWYLTTGFHISYILVNVVQRPRFR